MNNIVFFDIETTGLDTVQDQIVEIALVKVDADSFDIIDELCLRIKPDAPMNPDAQAVHGISMEDLANCPKFAEVAQQIYDFISNCYVCGHNIMRFDALMLSEEFSKCGIVWPTDKSMLLDTYIVEKTLMSHSLIATYKRYFGEDYQDTIGKAHGAHADTLATVKVMQAQMAKHNINSIKDVNDMSVNALQVDLAGKLARKTPDGPICYTFGKYANMPVLHDIGYAKWMLGQAFPSETKARLVEVIAGKLV